MQAARSASRILKVRINQAPWFGEKANARHKLGEPHEGSNGTAMGVVV